MRVHLAILLVLVVLVGSLGACGVSPETRRKQAQSNGDKYFEFLKANDPAGAYKNTFSSKYKQQLDLDAFLRFSSMMMKAGPIDSYQVVHYDVDPAQPKVTLTYAVQTKGLNVPLMYDVRMGEEGTEWRIDSIEPNMKPQAPVPTGQGPPSTGQLPAPNPAPAKP